MQEKAKKKGTYIVQECIAQNEQLAVLYAGAVNTFRVITYLWDGEVFHVPLALRIGQLIKTAKKLHLNAPQLGIISWDLTVDQNGVFVLIEANTRGQSIWFPQMANGMGAFGKNTAEILKFIAQK